MSGSRPLLLLDVDGVLSPTGNAVPAGFERRTTDRYDVVVNPRHGPWLATLLDAYEVTWVTTWGESANAVFGAIFDLPRLPALALGDLPRAGTRKLGAVSRQVGERALAWVDDELYDDAQAWARSRAAPTLLVRTRGSIGLTEGDVAELLAFAGRGETLYVYEAGTAAQAAEAVGTALGVALELRDSSFYGGDYYRGNGAGVEVIVVENFLEDDGEPFFDTQPVGAVCVQISGGADVAGRLAGTPLRPAA